jgi:hypothetical protein
MGAGKREMHMSQAHAPMERPRLQVVRIRTFSTRLVANLFYMNLSVVLSEAASFAAESKDRYPINNPCHVSSPLTSLEMTRKRCQ